MVEAALVLPIFMIMTVGTLELGLFLWQRDSATKATQLGARLAIVQNPIASGNGLTSVNWAGLPLGKRCRDTGITCPQVNAVCTNAGCSGQGGYTLNSEAFTTLYNRMHSVFPRLRQNQIEVRYVSNNRLGFVGQPGAVSVDVTVRIVNMNYDWIAIDGLLGLVGGVIPSTIPINASTTLPSEDLSSNQG